MRQRQDTQVVQTQQETQNLITVADLHKKYNEGQQNEVHVLKGMNFSIPKGQMVAIMGPSGCGKTTLLNVLGGLDNFSSGSIQINGTSIGELDEKTLTKYRRQKIGYIFQLFNLFKNQTALENVSLPLLLQEEDPTTARDRAKMMLYEVGLVNRFDEKPAKLSGGEQQKVAIARALITNPKLLLADEPTGDLDVSVSEDIMELFKRMQRENPDMSIVIVTHSKRIASKCDRIISIQNGVIDADKEVQ